MHPITAPSRLVRLLRTWSAPEAGATVPDPAEAMAGWLGAVDAIGLQAVHQQLAALPAGRQAAPAQRQATRQALTAQAGRVREALAAAIGRELLPLAAARGPDGAWAAYHERQQELQRRMEQMVGALRTQVQAGIATLSPRLRQLAILDAALAPVVSARTQQLLPGLAAPLKRRYTALRRAAGPLADTPPGAPPPAWLAAFDTDWRAALLAELELRLEPVQGLLDALEHD